MTQGCFRYVAASVAIATAFFLAPEASAGSQIVRTASGQVKCSIEPSFVVCERLSGEGFLQAPLAPKTPAGQPPWHWNLVGFDERGNYEWRIGNIGGMVQGVVMAYGQTYQFNGWTVQASSSGTRFTNDSTGRGTFVSIENVYSF